jgi:hypothetical protein
MLLVGCMEVFEENALLEEKRYPIYLLAKEAGYYDSYEEWLKTIRGIDGTSIDS